MTAQEEDTEQEIIPTLRPGSGQSNDFPEPSDINVSNDSYAAIEVPNIPQDPHEITKEMIFITPPPPPPPPPPPSLGTGGFPSPTEISQDDEFPLQKPALTPKDEKAMKYGFICNNPADFYNGIFAMEKGRFYKPSSQSGFVMIFADMKKGKPVNNDYLVDANKETEWYSTKMANPSITFFFPYHTLTVSGIGFRTHTRKEFGRFFLTEFVIYGIDDNKEIVCLGNYESTKLRKFETKATYPISSKKPLRAIRIESRSGKFGLSYLEIYGTGMYSEVGNNFTKAFLTDPSTYSDVPLKEKVIDNDDPHNGLKKKFMKKMKQIINGNDVREWSDHSDDIKPPPKRRIQQMVPQFISQFDLEGFEATDPNGLSISDEYCRLTGKQMDLYPPSSRSVIDSFDMKFINRAYKLVFSNMIISLTGIKITLSSREDSPLGFSLFVFSFKDQGYIHVFSSKVEELIPGKAYYYPINFKTECRSIMLTTPLPYTTIISHIDFYGEATVKKAKFLSDDDSEEILNSHVVADLPNFDFADSSRPGIIEEMTKYYGSMLIDFMEIYPHSERTTGFLHFSKRSLESLDTPSGIYFYFPQHLIKLTGMKIKASEEQCLGPIYVIINEEIVYQSTDTFQPDEERLIQIPDAPFTNLFEIFNRSGPFKIDDIEFYGILQTSQFTSCPKITKFVPQCVREQVIEEHNQQYRQERLNGMISNPNIVLSARNTQKPGIIEIGRKQFHSFVSFYNYGKNGRGLLDQDSDYLWMSTTSGSSDSFKLLFNHHSIRLTAFAIHTASDPRFSQYMPQNFDIYGYNSHNKRWDVLKHVSNSKPLDFMSRYVFKIKSDVGDAFYRLIEFRTFCGRVALAYVEVYGDLIEEYDDAPTDVASCGDTTVSYNNQPIISTIQPKRKVGDGILQKALEIYGYSLNGFVKVLGSTHKDRLHVDIWDARGLDYTSGLKYAPIFIHFIFIHHKVIINNYHIQADLEINVDNWCLIGCQSYKDEGEVIALEKNKKLKNDGYYYEYDIPVEFRKPYRVIRFVGLNDHFSFKSLDFFGMATPAPEITEWGGTFTFPNECSRNYVGLGS